MKPLCWPNTVRLTLSIQHSSEIMLLLQDDALPMIEYLNITNEEIPGALLSHRDKRMLTKQPCEYNGRWIGEAIRLRSLIIRYISLGDLNVLIGAVKMSVLEEFILVDLYTNSKLLCNIC